MFNKFFKGDFVHIEDFKKFEADLNKRLTQIEGNFNKEVLALKTDITAAIAGHVHATAAPGAPSPGIPGPPPAPAVPSATPILAVADTFAQQQDARQQALGPSAAPLGQGVSPEVIKARVDVKSDIGIA